VQASTPRARLAILGTRGIPARYGGFETFAEELAPRLAARGHNVWVYARRHGIGETPEAIEDGLTEYRGVVVRVLAAPRSKHLETIVHSFLAACDAFRRRFDAVLVCNAANFHTLPELRLSGARTVVNVDGLEWRRRKWGGPAKAWHRAGAWLVTRWANELVADSQHVQAWWEENQGRRPTFIPYGCPAGPVESDEVLRRLGLRRRGYVLYVARLEPENNAQLVVEAFRRVETDLPLVIVGHAPYSTGYQRRLRGLADRDPRVLLAGPIYETAYAELQSHAYCYVQASDVGGTHPALLEALGYGGAALVNDIPEHLEVTGDAARVYRFNDPASLAAGLQELLDDPAAVERLRESARQRVRERYLWDHVTDAYENILIPRR
jgi:glycosyltransferase involved in cell wall biosynthesis